MLSQLVRDAPYSDGIIPAHLAAFLHTYWKDYVRELEAERFALRLNLR